MPQPTAAAAAFADGLNAKFAGAYEFTVEPGRVWDRIVERPLTAPGGESVHAFIRRDTGFVHKAETFKRPSPTPRYSDVDAAVAAADPYRSYLYARR